jgi:short-subunit dehydrogenase
MKTWCITGAGAGIGRALTEAAASRGDRVYTVARREAQKAEIEALAPGRITALIADVADTGRVEQALRPILDAGELDVLVNNAGIGMVGAIEETSLEEARALFDINVFGLLAVTKALLPALKASRGHVVNLSSGVGLSGSPGMPIYSASKHAVEGLSDALAGELAPAGVRVSVVEPGPVQTGFATRNAMEAARRLPDYAALTGGGRKTLEKYYTSDVPTAEDAAAAIVVLADMPSPPLRLLFSGSVMSAQIRRDALQDAIDRAIL